MENTSGVEQLFAFFSKYVEVKEEEKTFLKEVIQIKKFQKKEIVLREGDPQRYLGFILSGALRFFYVDNDGEEQTVGFAFENNPIGNFNKVMSDEVSPVTVKAIEETVLLGISKEHTLQFMNQYPHYYMVLTNVLGVALIDLTMRDKLLRISSSRERYEALCEIQPQIAERATLTHIASYLKMALGTLSRVRAGKL